MARRKKRNILKAIVQNSAVRNLASAVGKTAINAIPSAQGRAIAAAAGNLVGVATRKRRRGKRGGSGVTQVGNQTVQYSNAPTQFGVTVGANAFSSRSVDNETIECTGKLDLPCTIGMFNPSVAENDGALIEPDAIEPQEAFVFNPLNVASNDVQSRLGKAAQTYTKFCWKEMTIEYIPSTTTENPGQFDMAVSWDPTQSAPAEAADLLNFDSSVETSAWKPTRLPVNCPPAGSKEDWCFNELTQDGAANTKLNFACQLFAMIRKPGTFDATPAPETWGTLCLHYKCQLTKPTLDDTEMSLMMSMNHRVGNLSPSAMILLESMLQHEWNKRAKEIDADQTWFDCMPWMRKGASKAFPHLVTKDEIETRAKQGTIPPFAFRSNSRSRGWRFLGRIVLNLNSNDCKDAVTIYEYPKGIKLYQIKSSQFPSENPLIGDYGSFSRALEELRLEKEALTRLREESETGLSEIRRFLSQQVVPSGNSSGPGNRTPRIY